jgi:NAD(P)-dependent dehydrogenase (short-subunit alcohol dehydrogenase family)
VELKGKIVVITGAAGGIGRAMARRFAKEGPRRIICADLDGPGAMAVAAEVGGWGLATDVSR